jgi:diguanylate cyclase (GGDEF)-like protein
LIGLISSLLTKCSRLSILLLSVALILAIGALDFVTGYDLSFGLFYTAPIIILSWYVSRPAAILGALLCAITWYFANSFAAPALIRQPVLLWNSAIRLGFFIAIAYPINALREAYTRERESARTDPLTGVANSREFHESAKLELLRAWRVGYPLTLLYLDLDNFKTINDTLGHGAGDELLMKIGHALKEVLRATDLVGRLGGDEFAILLPNTTEDQATPVIRKIEQAVSREAQALELTVGVSIGAATPSTLPAIIDEMIAMADARMFQAKNSKRSNIPTPRTYGAA